MDQFLRLITLQDANTRIVLVGTVLLGIASAVVGSFAVLRRRALVGDAVAHAALPGICLAYFIVGERRFGAFIFGALVLGIAAAAFISTVKRSTRIKEDAAIGMAIGGFFGIGVVLSRIIQNRPSGNRAGLDSFIFGKAAAMVTTDARYIAAIAFVVIAAITLLYKELRLLCFDREFAESQGWPAQALDLGLMGLICLCTVVGLPAVGVVLMVSLLIIPAVAARFWTERLGVMLLIAAVFGGASGALGTALSATIPAPASGLSRGWPTGPLITLVAGALFVASLLFAPRRGVAAEVWRRFAYRRRIATQNVLRTVYESLEPGDDFTRSWQPESMRASAATVRRMRRAGLVIGSGESLTLTPAGLAAARHVVRSHRLWELFLIEQADIAPDHVDRDADQIEHLLAADVLKALESRLARQGRMPGVPGSPHPTSPAAEGAP